MAALVAERAFLTAQDGLVNVLDGLMYQRSEKHRAFADRSELQILEKSVLLGAVLEHGDVRWALACSGQIVEFTASQPRRYYLVLIADADSVPCSTHTQKVFDPVSRNPQEFEIARTG